MHALTGKTVAILATDGFEESELLEPLKELNKAGAIIHVISNKGPEIKAWRHGKWGQKIKVDKKITAVDITAYNALILPGGVINPDKLRRDEKVIRFVKDFFNTGKTLAAICHGPQLLIEADVLKNKTMTSFYSIRKDLENAGAKWQDEEVVVDGNLITSRNPDDLKVFCKTIIDQVR